MLGNPELENPIVERILNEIKIQYTKPLNYTFYLI